MAAEDVISASLPVHDRARMQRIGDTNQFVIIATDEGLNNVPALTDAQRRALIGSNKGTPHRHIIFLDRKEENGNVSFVPTRAFTGNLRLCSRRGMGRKIGYETQTLSE